MVAVINKFPKTIIRLLVILALVFLVASQKFPQLFSPYQFQYKNFVIHSPDKIPESMAGVLNDAILLLSKSPIYNDKTIYKIYLSNSDLSYGLTGPNFSAGSFAKTNVFNNISIRRCEFGNYICYSNSKIYRERPLSALIAHEVTHVNMRESIGLNKENFLKPWIKEGYADYIANNSSFTDPDAFNLYISGANISSKSFEYYAYRMLVTYCIEKKGLTFQELAYGDYDVVQLWNEQRASLAKQTP